MSGKIHERLAPIDRTLVLRFLEHREESAFRKLYRRHTPRLYRLALRLPVLAAADAEEAVQEVWIRAVERLHTFEWRSSFTTWLTGIAINVFRERERSDRSAGRVFRPDGPACASTADPPSTAGSPDRRIELERAIAALPPGYRRVFVLHDIEGYTHPQIAEALGIEEGTSKSQLSRARQALRELLQSERRDWAARLEEREP
jgi:RNA polymerase sigma-70 factor (ECF subfamily)